MSGGPGAPAGPAADGQALLEGLDEEQRQAVTHGEGPLLIVAGAGTGKTRVIAHRIAWLINTGRAKPEQILALTFTEKAAFELEARVDVLVPLGMTGTRMDTFNAFGDSLVREHAIELGLTSAVRVESRAEILVFLREHLFELGLARYLPLGEPERHLEALVSLFDRARDDDISPAAYGAFAERLAAEAGEDPEKLDQAAAELEKARAYAAFDALLMKHGRIDFGHQISLALRLLRERPYVRREVQDTYRYILVDEFQDTNHVQFELVKLLAGARANLTVVGDDDQSIYRFRGARVENLIGFLEAFPAAREVLLTRNYRSGQRILDAAYRLIRCNNPHRLEPLRNYDKKLRSQVAFEGEVEPVCYVSGGDEADAVAGEIAEAIADGVAEPGEFAILARAHVHLDPFASALKARGIRFHRQSTRGLYARAEVQLCLNMLRAVADPDDGGAVFLALGDPLFGVDPVELARLSATAKRRNIGLLRVAEETAEHTGSELAPESRAAIARFAALHRALSATAGRRPTSDVLYAFVTDSGLLAGLTAVDSAEHLEKIQNLNRLFAIVTRVSPLLQRDRVDAFMGHLDLLIEAGDDPAAAEVERDEEAVQLLTVHNAKGLEFRVVYMVQMAAQRFPSADRPEQLPIPPGLRGTPPDDDDAAMREERRLCYVGMTRAKERLVMSYAADYGGKRERKPSRFLLEAFALQAAPKGGQPLSPREAIARFAPIAELPPPELAPLPVDAPLSISHSRIKDYLDCPFKYRFAHVAQLPLPHNPVLMYGNAVHHAIQVYLQHRIKGLPFDADDAAAAFASQWRGEGFLSTEHERQRREQGQREVRRFVADGDKEARFPLRVEAKFEFRRGHTTVTGRWDRIDEASDGIVITDYKTSDIDDPERAETRLKDDLRGGQLGLYALAYEATCGVVPVRAQLHFVGSGVVGSAAVKPEHLERAAERIDVAAAGIRSGLFPAKPDRHTCSYCDFSRFCQHSATRAGVV